MDCHSAERCAAPSALSRYDAFERSRGRALIGSAASDQCVMSFVSQRQCGKIWERFVFTARWHKVKEAFCPQLVNSYWLQLGLNSYILYEFVIAKGSLRSSRTYWDLRFFTRNCVQLKRPHLRRRLIGLHPHRAMSCFISWLLFFFLFFFLQRKRVRRLQLCGNVMWINLIGLLSGVIALCGPWEHPQQSPRVSGSAGNYWHSADSGRKQKPFNYKRKLCTGVNFTRSTWTRQITQARWCL